MKEQKSKPSEHTQVKVWSKYCSFPILKSEIYVLGKLLAIAVIWLVFSLADQKLAGPLIPLAPLGFGDEMIVTLFSFSQDYRVPDRFNLERVDRSLWIPLSKFWV